MNMIRRIDFYGQAALGTLMLLSVPVLLLYGFLAGLFVLGIWQLLSSASNTAAFIHSSFKKEIAWYWKWVVIIFAVLFLVWPVSSLIFDQDDTIVIGTIGIGCSPLLAIYYLRIYKKLIDHLELRKELSGFTKSKL